MRVRRKHIRQVAERLLDAHGINLPPVDVKRIAVREGLKVVLEIAEDSMSGFLDRRGPRPLIGVNRCHSKQRKRFTIAHELGHFFLHSQSLYFDESVLRFRDAASSEGIDIDEVEANLFAAELLMPKRFLDARFEELSGLDINNDVELKKLADEFRVSTQALIYRLNYLDLASPPNVSV